MMLQTSGVDCKTFSGKSEWESRRATDCEESSERGDVSLITCWRQRSPLAPSGSTATATRRASGKRGFTVIEAGRAENQLIRR